MTLQCRRWVQHLCFLLRMLVMTPLIRFAQNAHVTLILRVYTRIKREKGGTNMHLIVSIGATVAGIGVCIGVLGGHPLWQWFTHRRETPSIYETNPWMFDDFDQDDDEPLSTRGDRR